jgi:hypothetical protein
MGSLAQKPAGVHPIQSDEDSFSESLQVDAETLESRGFASNFCAAWLAFWRWALINYGEHLEEAYRLTFPEARPLTGAKIVTSCARSTMALLSAAVRADKAKSQRRRFKCAAWALESYRAGAELVAEGLPKEEAQRQRANLSRYWRSRWQVLHLFMCVTQLPLFPRSARDWEENCRAHDAAAYTDQASELLFEVMGRAAPYRQGLSRVKRFELAVAAAAVIFRERFGPYAPGYALPEISGPPSLSEQEKPATVLPFRRVKAKLLAGLEAVKARAEAGQLTASEIDELVLMLAPLAALAGAAESAKEDGVSLADSAENPPEKTAPNPGPEKCDFSGKSENRLEATADKFIRIDSPEFAPSGVPLDAFLAAFRPTAAEAVKLRAFGPRGAPTDEARFEPRKVPTSRRALAAGGELLEYLRGVNETRGLYFVVNQGGDCDDEITRITAFFAEADDGSISEQHARLDACPLPPSVRVETLKSVHAYWLAAPGCAVEEWREVQRRLIHYFGSDPKIKNPSRVMRLPGFNHVSYADGQLSYKPVTLAAFEPSRRFTASAMLAAFPAPVERLRAVRTLDITRAAGSDLVELKRELGALIMAHDSARRNRSGKWDCRALCHGGKGSTGLFYDPADDGVICNRGCDLMTIARAFGVEMTAPRVPRFSVERERGEI